MKPHYPFAAIVGQQRLKTALLVCAVDSGIGGVLISGPRGTAKSTLARSVADLIDGGNFVNLPLGCSEEKLIGTLDLEKALQGNAVEFEPGLLAKAHGGILYVDEVNLLADHLVDALLDTAASGVNQVERDGISHEHAADFVLIGTMNPDEGELRPQLLDRFGLLVELDNRFTVSERQQVMQQRLAFDDNPETFCKQFAAEQQQLAEKLQTARQQLASVTVSTDMQTMIAELCGEAQVEGLRADIALYRAARAHAALQGRDTVAAEDIEAVQEFVLAHRRKHSPQTPPQGESSPQTPQSNTSGAGQGSQQKQTGSSIQGSWGAMESEIVSTGARRSLPGIETTNSVKKKR